MNKIDWGIWTFIGLPFFLFLESPVYADFFLHSWENQFESKSYWSFQLSGMDYFSNKNFDSSSASYKPEGLSNYNRVQSDVLVRYGITDRFSAFTRISWAYVSQTSAVRFGSGYGLADQTLGLNFRAYGPPIAIYSPKLTTSLDLQAQIDFPGYNTGTSAANQIPDLGDGSIDFTSGAFLTIPILSTRTSMISSIIGAGYTYRTLSYSPAIPWSMSFQFKPYSDGFFTCIDAFGFFSTKSDPFNGITSPLRSNDGSGGSFMTGDVNASIVQVRAQIGFKLGPLTEASLSATQSVWGQAAPNGLNLMFGFMTRIGRDVNTNTVLLTPQTYGESNQGFLNYSLDAKVIRFNERLNLVKIDKGSQDGIEAGQVFDIFLTIKDGASIEAIARAKVSNVRINEAALEVIEYYKDVKIEEGFLIKRLVQ